MALLGHEKVVRNALSTIVTPQYLIMQTKDKHSEEPVAGNLHGGFCGGRKRAICASTRHNINHNVMIDILRERISDERFLRLIRKFLNAGYIENWTYNNTYSGTPQGEIISPILANIYLDKLYL